MLIVQYLGTSTAVPLVVDLTRENYAVNTALFEEVIQMASRQWQCRVVSLADA